MPATDPASVHHASDALLRVIVLSAAVAWLAAGCTPAGWEPPAPPAPVVVEEDSYPDDSVDGAGEPAGIEEILHWGPDQEEEVAENEPAPELVPLDPDGVARDLLVHFPGLLAGGLPPAALDQVLRYVNLFHAGRARANFERWLVREGRYRDLILQELAAAGLPEELLYLSMLESGFSPTAVSRAGAVGLWQFMAATGRASGLRVDDWVDERRDPVAATRAAIEHLTVLHNELGDWALAAAAYNAGLGRVRRTRGSSGAGYFDLTLNGRLPAETRSYVPLILAASHVARHREHYGFREVEPVSALAYDTVHVDGRTRLSVLAQVMGLPQEEVTALNTHLVRGAAPPGRSYAVRVPVGSRAFHVAERLAAIPADDRLLPEYREIYAVVRPGDSWWRIARNHGVTVRDLRARNPRVGDVIHPGMRLLVDRRVVRDGEGGGRPAAASASTSSPAAASTPVRTASASASSAAGGTTYRVRRGDTMSGIAAARGIRLADLAHWNGMSAPRPLREGEVIRLTPPAPRRHRVERGETLTSVARRYGVTIGDLVRWNGLGSARPLRMGEILVVEAGETARRSEASP
jgi:membrane-bound lytic murein transglycosylase D